MENQLKVTELRLGNYLFDRNNRLCQVKELGESIKAPAIKGARTSLPNKPIPLTEDILLRLGFVKKEIGYSKFTEMDQCFLISFGKHTSVNGIKFNNEIKTVHQLQNLFFALTGEELTFKIKISN